MPLAIYLASDAGETQTASVLVVIMTLFSFLVIYGLNRWRKKSVSNLIGAVSND
jgi:molybdate transport system permease protein